MDGLAESLRRSPELFPHALDLPNDAVCFIRLTRAEYSNASFLDARVLSPRTLTSSIPWPALAASIAAAELAERCGFIFHIGHVGSTLLSRLIGAHAEAFSLREPLVLRGFAQLRATPQIPGAGWNDREYASRLGGCVKLLSRTYEARQISIIKATSFVSELAAELLIRASLPKAVFMFVSPEIYLATMFGGAVSRQEAAMLAPSRLRRLQRRVGREVWRLAARSEGEALALGWACEMSALAHAARAAGQRVLRLDFDEFLADPSAFLLDALRHFGIDATLGEVHAILAGPDLRRYSKAPEHAYDSALRLEVLNEARASHGAEIKRGLAWLERAAADFAPVRDGVAFAETANR